MKSNDLTVGGPGTPISMKKLSEGGIPSQRFIVLVDGTHSGYIHDDPSIVKIDFETCSMHAKYYRETYHKPLYWHLYIKWDKNRK